MRKLKSDEDYEAVSKILTNFYNAYPHPQSFELMTPNQVIDDYALYLVIRDYMLDKGLLSIYSGSNLYIITNKGIDIIENHGGDIRSGMKSQSYNDFVLELPIITTEQKKSKEVNWQMWSVIATVILGLLSILVAVILKKL